MGHHHRKNRIKEQPQQPQVDSQQNAAQNPFGNMDLSSMLGSLNLDNIDLSKIDMDKVQSVMNKIKLPENSSGSGPINSNNGSDPRINLLNSLKGILPGNRAKTVDNITKFLQLGQLMNNHRSTKH